MACSTLLIFLHNIIIYENLIKLLVSPYNNFLEVPYYTLIDICKGISFYRYLLISSIKKTDNAFKVIGFLGLTIVCTFDAFHVCFIHLDRFQHLLECHEQYQVRGQG